MKDTLISLSTVGLTLLYLLSRFVRLFFNWHKPPFTFSEYIKGEKIGVIYPSAINLILL